LAQTVLKMGDNQAKTNVAGQTDDVFAKLVADKSGGRIKIEVYHNAQLGEETEMIQQIQYGSLDLAQVSLSPLVEFEGSLNVLQMPYLYRNADHFWKVMSGTIGDQFLASMSGSGIVGLAWVDGGARSFYTIKKPIKQIGDLKGLKIRVQQSSLMLGMVKAMGAVPVALPYADVYSALQSGVIDGAENNYPSYVDSSHYEVAKNYTDDHHTMVPDLIIMSAKKLASLPKADQDLIRECAKLAQKDHHVRWQEASAKAEKTARDAGSSIIVLDDITDFQKAVQPLYDDPSIGGAYKPWVEKIRAVK
jgi:tripartite ATP-independent transporter DctP family solute receptor